MISGLGGTARLIILADDSSPGTTTISAWNLVELDGDTATIHVFAPQAIVEPEEPKLHRQPEWTTSGKKKRRPWRGR